MRRLTFEEFVERGKAKHAGKYAYCRDAYVNLRTKTSIFCPEHGEFYQAPQTHLRGCECPKCAGYSPVSFEDFEERSNEVHNHKYSYSRGTYVNTQMKTRITCSIHGEFRQTPSAHMSGQGCFECGRHTRSFLTRMSFEEFEAKATQVHNGRYIYSADSYEKGGAKTRIICHTHGVFVQEAHSHLQGRGCPICARSQIGCSNTLTFREFEERARSAHSDKYTYDPISYVNVTTRIVIVCPTHGKFKQRPMNHMLGHGCPDCGREATCLTHEEFLAKARMKHGSRYEYPEEYFKSNSKITIVCLKHGPFRQTPNTHMKGRGCAACGREASENAKWLTHEEFLAKARMEHGSRYEYPEEYVRGDRNITIVCLKHGPFSQEPQSHLEGHGCPDCGREATCLTHEEFLAKARMEHGSRYEYPEEYVRGDRNITIVCLKHGPFSQEPNSHMKGCGCPKCASTISKPETQWLDFNRIPLRQHPITLLTGRRVRVDGYDPTTNTVYEFHGDYFHGNPSRYASDKINEVNGKKMGILLRATVKRGKDIRKAGYNYVFIWESDWKNFCAQQRKAA